MTAPASSAWTRSVQNQYSWSAGPLKARFSSTRQPLSRAATVAKLLGHALVETTERYVHLSDQSVADAADRVSGCIHAALAGRVEGAEGGFDHAQG